MVGGGWEPRVVVFLGVYVVFTVVFVSGRAAQSGFPTAKVSNGKLLTKSRADQIDHLQIDYI